MIRRLKQWLRGRSLYTGRAALDQLVKELEREARDIGDQGLTVLHSETGGRWVCVDGHRTVGLEVTLNGDLLISLNLDFITDLLIIFPICSRAGVAFKVNPELFIMLTSGNVLWGQQAYDYKILLTTLQSSTGSGIIESGSEDADRSTANSSFYTDLEIKGYKH